MNSEIKHGRCKILKKIFSVVLRLLNCHWLGRMFSLRLRRESAEREEVELEERIRKKSLKRYGGLKTVSLFIVIKS